MYQVIKMYGDNEPWWFFEGWKHDIIEQQEFVTFEQARAAYEQAFADVSDRYSHLNAKANYLAAFWQDGDERWCEECDDDLQQYMGLALLKAGKPIEVISRKEFYEATNSSGKAKCCKRLEPSA